MANTKQETCKCGSGKPITMRGFDKNGKVVFTRCADCEPRVSDTLSFNAITSRR